MDNTLIRALPGSVHRPVSLEDERTGKSHILYVNLIQSLSNFERLRRISVSSHKLLALA